MSNPDPTQFIFITEHIAALVSQQAEFDQSLDALRTQIVAKDSTIADLAADKTRAQAESDAVKTAVEDKTLDAAATAAAILGIIAAGKVPENDRKRAEKQKQIAVLEAEIAKL